MDAEVHCPVCDRRFLVEVEDAEDGSTQEWCPGCESLLDVSYAVRVTTSAVRPLSTDIRFECPHCGCAETVAEVTEERGSTVVRCRCGKHVEVEWSAWGGRVEVEIQRRLVVTCPACASPVDVGPADASGGSAQVACDHCSEWLDVEWDAEEVWVETGSKEYFDCPVCDRWSATIDDVVGGPDEQEGGTEVECEVCHAGLQVDWRFYGRRIYDEYGDPKESTVEVQVIERPCTEVECPVCSAELTLDDIEDEDGEREIGCECGARLTVRWSGWGADAEVVLVEGSFSIETECPVCPATVSVEEVEEETGEAEVECEACEARLRLTWSEWGGEVDAEVLSAGDVETVCPVDGASLFVDDVREEMDTEEVFCDGCGATVEVSWTGWGEQVEATVLYRSSIQLECPLQGCPITLDEISSENGSDDIQCEGCDARLSIYWSSWGEEIEVEPV